MQSFVSLAVLTAAHQAVALPSLPDVNDVAGFQRMQPRSASPRGMPQGQEFPARYLQEFESHHWKRQEGDIAVDTDLQVQESWYWGAGETICENHPTAVDTDFA